MEYRTITKAQLKTILAKHKKFLQGSVLGERADLSGTDLRYFDLSGVNLSRAILRRANLYGVCLSNAQLAESDLRNADIRQADLSYANVSGALLNNADLQRAQCLRACMTCTDLRGSDMRKSWLCQADLREACIRGADLRGACIQYGTFLSIADLPTAEAGGTRNSRFVMHCVYEGLKDQTEPLFWCGCVRGVTASEMRRHIRARESHTNGLAIVNFLLKHGGPKRD